MWLTSLAKWIFSGIIVLFDLTTQEPQELQPDLMFLPIYRDVAEEPYTATPYVCSLPADSGQCRALKMRYYYDLVKGRCTNFVYGGCGGNENKFHSLEECMQVCQGGRSYDESMLPFLGARSYLMGPHMFPSQFPDPYGESHNVCYFPPDPGMCRAIIPKFYYDTQKRRCAEFTYGGCGGNENNFNNLWECMQHCQYG